MKSDERGSSTGELVILLPVLMLIVLLVVHVGKMTHTAVDLQQVAEVAARDASMSSRRRALSTAIASSQRELRRSNLHCSRVVVSTEEAIVSGLQSITVRLACNVSQKDFRLLNLLPTNLEVSALSVVDRYRGE